MRSSEHDVIGNHWENDDEVKDSPLTVPKGYIVGESEDWGFMILKRNDDYPVFTYSVVRRSFITREAAILWLLAGK